jgi:hypothetical protein
VRRRGTGAAKAATGAPGAVAQVRERGPRGSCKVSHSDAMAHRRRRATAIVGISDGAG